MLPTTNPRKAAPNVLSKDGRPSIPDGDGAISERGGDERKDCDGTLKVAETGFCLIPGIDWLMLVETVVMRSFVLESQSSLRHGERWQRSQLRSFETANR